MPIQLHPDRGGGRRPRWGARTRNLRGLRRYLRPYYGQMAWLLLAAASAMAASIAVPLVIGKVIDGPIRDRDPRALPLLGGLALGLGLIEVALNFIRRWTHAAAALGMETTLRSDLYRRLQRLPVEFHHRWRPGQLLSRAMSDLLVLRRFLSFGLIFGTVNIAMYLTVIAVLLHTHWPLGMVAVLSSVPLLMIRKRLSDQLLSSARVVQEQRGDLTTLIEEAAQGIAVIRGFGRHDHIEELFGQSARRLHDAAVGRARVLAASWARYDLVPDVALAAVLVTGAVEVSRNRLTLGALVAFIALQTMMAAPIRSLGWIIALGQEAIAAADRLHEVLDAKPSIVDRRAAVRVDRRSVRGHLRFVDVGFAYPGKEPILSGIDLDLEPGETIALVGATGCGKTTLISLVPRLLDVTHGRITLDGRDIRDYQLRSLRTLVGAAFEDPTLFSMSFRENLTIGRPHASDAEIAEAIAIAQAEFVYKLPHGLHTMIGERGGTLSGGQRQRLALARAVLGRPRILVLDDPLSALDVHTEALIETALADVMRDTTAIVVAHRPSTVALADRAALLSKGGIAAIGSHATLLAKVPEYAAILSTSPSAKLNRDLPPGWSAHGDPGERQCV